MKYIKFSLLAVLLMGLYMLPFDCAEAGLFGPPKSLQESGEELADEFGSVKQLEGKRIAVLEFEAQGGVNDSILGKRIAENVSSGLVNVKDRGWSIVERMEMARLQNELEEHRDSVFNFTDWMRKELQADVMVLGHYTLSGEKLLITAKVINPQNGSVIASESIWQPVNSEIRILSKTRKPKTKFAASVEDITAILTGSDEPDKNTGSPTNADTLSAVKIYKVVNGNRVPFKGTDIPVFKVGDKMGFAVSSPISSRLYILNYDPGAEKGEAVFLYPIPGLKTEIFSAQQTRRFPSFVSDGVISYDVEEPLGRMVLKIIGVDDAIDLNLTKNLKSEHGYYWLDSSNLSLFMNDLASLPASSWWSEDVEFWIQ